MWWRAVPGVKRKPNLGCASSSPIPRPEYELLNVGAVDYVPTAASSHPLSAKSRLSRALAGLLAQ